MAGSTAIRRLEQKAGQRPDSKAVLAGSHSKELFFAVVGPVGAGASQAIKALERVCKSGGYGVELVKASDLIRSWAEENKRIVPGQGSKTLDMITELQNLGDSMREHDMAEVAKAAMREIAQRRANCTGQKYIKGEKVVPDDAKRVYLIDSIRHPAEIHLLRRTYGNAFGLIGVVCEEGVRRARILEKYFRGPEKGLSETQSAVDRFMDRDSDDSSRKHGQHVAKPTCWLASRMSSASIRRSQRILSVLMMSCARSRNCHGWRVRMPRRPDTTSNRFSSATLRTVS